jgi:cytochrome P450
VESRTPEQRQQYTEIVIDIINEQLNTRLRKPTGDLFSDITVSEVDGRRLRFDEMQSMCFLLFLAGLDTVVSGISFAMRKLALEPELQARLRATPADTPKYVEEALRAFGIATMRRLVARDLIFRDVHFKAGDMVLCMLPVAGLDQAANDEPFNFNLDREQPRHLAFSAGPHVCVGQHLARSEMRIVIDEWLRQIPSFRLADPATPPGGVGGAVIAIKCLPLAWEVSSSRT